MDYFLYCLFPSFAVGGGLLACEAVGFQLNFNFLRVTKFIMIVFYFNIKKKNKVNKIYIFSCSCSKQEALKILTAYTTKLTSEYPSV